ncbi:hypothetical protein [Priestia endophytica]|nr:hypothetical protein [Priestia endophytica]
MNRVRKLTALSSLSANRIAYVRVLIITFVILKMYVPIIRIILS